jgi:hypothetical protein
MQLLGKKIIKLQDAKFKIRNNKNNETSIFIEKDLASKINLIDGSKITFTLNEDNILRALSFLFQFKKQLYKKEKTELDQNWFSKEYNIIKKHFINDNKYTCKVNVSKGRFYLKSLTQSSGFNIRNILIEDHYEFDFTRDNKYFFLKINYSEEKIEYTKANDDTTMEVQKPIVQHKSLREFSFLAFKYVNNEFGDKFLTTRIEKFKTKIGVFHHTGYKIPEYFNSIRVFGAFENEDEFNKLTNSKERKRYNKENLNILGESNIYLTTEIEYPKGKNLFFGDYKRFIEDYSNKKYSIKKVDEIYVLHKLIVSEFNYKQEIYFGSPGTGKSRLIKQEYGNGWPRITFHPELDYQGFVGAYKPTMKPISDTSLKEEITYEFVPEAFIKAYCKAWKSNKPYYLIIEEINRGNCAQIFGDIFQLLDRDDKGYSEYPIECSPEIQKFLAREFNKNFDRKAEYEVVSSSIDFSRMALPNNLSILATMNTSDQSLFPMDSAFKRRWDWQYVPIEYDDARTNLLINIGEGYNWGDFISNVNKQIKEHTQSEDKQLGNRFVSPKNGIIKPKQFVSKVLFYLWTEIYKDEQGTGNTIFINSVDDSEILFGDFFYFDGKINESILISFLNHILPKEQTRTVTEQESDVTEDQSDN